MEMYLTIVLVVFIATLVVLYFKFSKEKNSNKVLSDRVLKLSQYEGLVDIDNAIQDKLQEKKQIEDESQAILANAKKREEKIIHEAKTELVQAEQERKTILKEARKKKQEIIAEADDKLIQASELANKITSNAENEARKIAGEAWQVRENLENYHKALTAIRNSVEGYGDQYLTPSYTLLDELSEEYSHKEAGQQLKSVRQLIKKLNKEERLTSCDYKEERRKITAQRFVLYAFNGKVEAILSKAKTENYGVLQQELHDTFNLVNHHGIPFRNARINQEYLDLLEEELRLVVTVRELKKKDQEEQRVIREQMREEERARREYEKARKQAEKEARILAKAMKEAEAKFNAASIEEKEKYEAELEKVRAQLAEAEEKGQRAMSMAQQTKQGHVYVISNIGSFGEDVYKIGLTRRLEPLDRVKELGDASVPFSFDVHAMIHSDDAPDLEKRLHKHFQENQVNKVNPRKEFFRTKIHEIRDVINEMKLETKWTMKAEAQEFRESTKLENDKKNESKKRLADPIENILDDLKAVPLPQ